MLAATDVVSVGRPYPIRQPHPRVVHANLRGRKPTRDGGKGGGGAGRHPGVHGQFSGATSYPTRDHGDVVIAGNEHDLTLGTEARADRSQRRGCRLHGSTPAALKQLDDVSEEHQPVDAVDGRE